MCDNETENLRSGSTITRGKISTKREPIPKILNQFLDINKIMSSITQLPASVRANAINYLNNLSQILNDYPKIQQCFTKMSFLIGNSDLLQNVFNANRVSFY